MPTVELTKFLIWYEILGKQGRLTDPSLPDAVRHMEPIKLWYETVGEAGPTLLQIHGLGLASAVFQGLSPRLAMSLNLVNVDLRGCGKSHRPMQEYSISEWASDLATALEKLGLEKVHVHGTSLGGMVAVELTLRYPGLVGSLILSSTVARLPEGSRQELSELGRVAESEELDGDTFVERFARLVFSSSYLASRGLAATAKTLATGLASDNTAQLFARICQAFREYDATPRVTELDTCTLILAGDEDRLVPLEASQALAEAIPRSELRILEGGGHYVVQEQPERVDEEIRAFLGV